MESKTVVVTGGTRGIGRAICEKFAKNGYNVVCFYQNSSESAKQLEELYQNIKTYQCDVSKSSKVQEIAQKVILEYKKVDVLVNNAGISKYHMFTDATEQDFDEIFDVNVKGTFNVTNAFIKNMVSNQNGVVINISSMWGQVGASMEVLYSSTKGAIIAFTKALAKEMGLSNIRVTCVAPGVINTEMLGDFTEQDLDNLRDETPLNRIGLPEDIANSVYFLATDEANFITGQILPVNGGFVI